jgi:hypothetical protein
MRRGTTNRDHDRDRDDHGLCRVRDHGHDHGRDLCHGRGHPQSWCSR